MTRAEIPDAQSHVGDGRVLAAEDRDRPLDPLLMNIGQRSHAERHAERSVQMSHGDPDQTRQIRDRYFARQMRIDVLGDATHTPRWKLPFAAACDAMSIAERQI